MKGNIKYWMLLLLVAGSMAGCKPEEIVLDPPPSKIEGINGTFILAEVIQVDPFVLAGPNSRDVSAVYTTGVAPTITFNSTAFTYAYVAGNNPDYLGAAGTWAFDDNDYPTLINMNDGTNSYALKLLHTIRPQDEFLHVQYERTCGAQTSIIYQFKFARN